jgi:hypothetical protein
MCVLCTTPFPFWDIYSQQAARWVAWFNWHPVRVSILSSLSIVHFPSHASATASPSYQQENQNRERERDGDQGRRGTERGGDADADPHRFVVHQPSPDLLVLLVRGPSSIEVSCSVIIIFVCAQGWIQLCWRCWSVSEDSWVQLRWPSCLECITSARCCN